VAIRDNAYELKGDRDKAITDYRKALSLKSRSPYDDKAKAKAERRLAELVAVEVGSKKDLSPTPASQTPAKF
jgi:hypothetical protein